MLLIAEDANDDTTDDADEAVIVGGEGEEEKWADVSGETLHCWTLGCIPIPCLIPFALFPCLSFSKEANFCEPEKLGIGNPSWSSPNLTSSGSSGKHIILPEEELGVEDETGLVYVII